MIPPVFRFVKKYLRQSPRISFPMDAFSLFFALLMLPAGLFAALRLGFFPQWALPRALRAVFSRPKKAKKGGVTPFSAMATALGGCVGTANIAGTAGAIALGGPGAVFWMWCAGLTGMGVKFAEIVLALRFRGRDARFGGPTSYIPAAFRAAPRLGKLFSKLFAVFALAAAAVSTPLVQANTAAGSIAGLFPGADPLSTRLIAGIAVALLAGLAVLSGAAGIGRISALAVPFMALAYALVCVLALFRFRAALPRALASIFFGAFRPECALAGVGSYSFAAALRVGAARGVYSNEAGVGSAAMAHAAADTDDPVRQGLFGVFEVFADTLVMCSLTALTVLASGVPLSGGGAEIARAAFAAVLGERASGIFLALSLLLFGYTSIIGWAVYSLSAARFLFGKEHRRTAAAAIAVFSAVGAVTRPALVWRFGETLNCRMALPNMAAVLLLLPAVKREVRCCELFRAKEKHGGKTPCRKCFFGYQSRP